MAINNHQYTKEMRDLLDIKLFSQPISGRVQPDLLLDDGKIIAGMYSKLENAISVLSDMRARKSYIFPGGVARQLGFEPTRTEINSIWEDELLARVHPEDLQKKYRLEFKFFQLIKSIDLADRLNYSLITRLRIRNREGKYVLIKHRLLYLSSTKEGDVWLTLCLYNVVYDHPGFDVPEGLIINSGTGTIVDSEQGRFEDILSIREGQILNLINLGLRSKEIASKLSLSIHTVNRHRQNIFQKLNVNNAMEACRVADAAGLLHRP
ncbi:response regulator transcription factor [Pedobacter panaciterrae]